jgi:uncharacterized protein YqgC (DUF456 family)
MASNISRREIGVITAIIIGLIIGFFIKRVHIGLLIGLFIGIVSGGLWSGRGRKEKE